MLLIVKLPSIYLPLSKITFQSYESFVIQQFFENRKILGTNQRTAVNFEILGCNLTGFKRGFIFCLNKVFLIFHFIWVSILFSISKSLFSIFILGYTFSFRFQCSKFLTFSVSIKLFFILGYTFCCTFFTATSPKRTSRPSSQSWRKRCHSWSGKHLNWIIFILGQVNI